MKTMALRNRRLDTQMESMSCFWKLHFGGNVNGLAIPKRCPGSSEHGVMRGMVEGARGL